MPQACLARAPGISRATPKHGVLHRVLDAHLDAFLDAAAAGVEGVGLPAFIEQEFRDCLTSGVLAPGFARLRCGECAFERLVPFSCKGRCEACPTAFWFVRKPLI